MLNRPGTIFGITNITIIPTPLIKTNGMINLLQMIKMAVRATATTEQNKTRSLHLITNAPMSLNHLTLLETITAN